MKIVCERLRQHYERVINLPLDLPPTRASVLALMDAHYWFHIIEGESSEPVSEAISILTSPGAWAKIFANGIATKVAT